MPLILEEEQRQLAESAREFLDRADGVIVHQSTGSKWEQVSLKPVAERPMFRIRPPEYVTGEMVEFVRTAIQNSKIQMKNEKRNGSAS